MWELFTCNKKQKKDTNSSACSVCNVPESACNSTVGEFAARLVAMFQCGGRLASLRSGKYVKMEGKVENPSTHIDITRYYHNANYASFNQLTHRVPLNRACVLTNDISRSSCLRDVHLHSSKAFFLRSGEERVWKRECAVFGY